jgi:hypothetical protein
VAGECSRGDCAVSESAEGLGANPHLRIEMWAHNFVTDLPYDPDLQDEHAVAVGEEAIAFADGVVVGVEDEVASCERADQHQQRGFG